MAWPAILMAAMAAAQVVGGVMQFNQIRSAGSAAKDASKFQAALAERRAQALGIQAGQERASGQRAAIEARRQGNFVAGRTRALAAASGASLASPSIVNNLAALEADAEYRRAVPLFESEQQARNLEYGAAVERAGGQAALESGRYQKQLSTAQANSALIGALAGAARSGVDAYQMSGGGGGGRASGPAPGSFRAAQEVGMDDTLLSSYGGSPLFTKYGRGGPRYA